MEHFFLRAPRSSRLDQPVEVCKSSRFFSLLQAVQTSSLGTRVAEADIGIAFKVKMMPLSWCYRLCWCKHKSAYGYYVQDNRYVQVSRCLLFFFGCSLPPEDSMLIGQALGISLFLQQAIDKDSIKHMRRMEVRFCSVIENVGG